MKSPLLSELERGFPNLTQHDPSFHQVVVDHSPAIRKESQIVSPFTFTPLIGAIYKGDFHGLLKYQKVDESLHHILTEFNGLSKTTDYDGSVMVVYTINPDYIDQLKKTYQARRKR